MSLYSIPPNYILKIADDLKEAEKYRDIKTLSPYIDIPLTASFSGLPYPAVIAKDDRDCHWLIRGIKRDWEVIFICRGPIRFYFGSPLYEFFKLPLNCQSYKFIYETLSKAMPGVQILYTSNLELPFNTYSYFLLKPSFDQSIAYLSATLSNAENS